MKLRSDFITQNVGSDTLMVAVGAAAKQFHGLVRMNDTAAFVAKCLAEDTTEEAIVDRMQESFDAERSVLERDVHAMIEQLRSIGALE